MNSNKTIKSLIAGLGLSLSLSTVAQTIALDKVVAIVDNDVVMASELQQQLALISKRLQAQNTELPPEGVLRDQVLEHLIRERLQLQMGQRAGVEISEQEISQAISRMAAGGGLSMEQFQQQLWSDGMSMAQFKERLRREMVINRVQKGSVNRRIHVSDQEIDNFLESQEGKFWVSPDYQLGHILISLSAGADEETVDDAKAKASDLYEQLSNGANFRELAIANSNGQMALQGGDLGWRKTSQLPSLLAEAVPSMSKGDVSEPIRSDAGFHILKLYDQRGGEETIVEQSKVRHILVKPSTILSDKEAFEKISHIREELQGGADFAELAKNHSEDIGSMLSGGDLGWSTPGQFVPEFEATMKATDIGQISEPFRSQFGWHILKVDERRQQDFTDTVIRNQAANIIGKRRFEEELPNWLQEIRDEAYVEIKLNKIAGN
ncbi:peptidylprolyl isomerase [Pseudoteredinibacter isoporae]|uniref:Chaperone SurA n=1 Tax=Pseudoteredinibacter isoporae TaxID=570281 RepID=A0A7X0JRX3_9GAMM|nr:peptidylprolyl isomerase [Pseudoteredinibacter isoporae]MBB6521169.1 peptidyl-prolyl cis-trans isomerase SurA [Pseudoteredinibacter isoporae]NHO86729.1 molecular chaperone SurA [Pseudoteredinibacter isoporae]NIB24819.1 molecular chaperone SurA [Pseudoteredinibacter isoporae]